MRQEYKVLLEGQEYTILVSDEQQALLAAKAAGRAVIGVEDLKEGEWKLKHIPYIIPSFEDITSELLERTVRRHLGLPWRIALTSRLCLRELTEEDGVRMPEDEGIKDTFCSREQIRCYIKNQYGFYQYGIWAVELRENGCLAGLAGVRNPELPPEFEQAPGTASWLELGYHIFSPYRGNGYAKEAVKAVAHYCHEELEVSLCAMIRKENKASCRVAESLGMKPLMVPEYTGAYEDCLLYGESC